ncbi:unnamed protein product [Urochloa humidicola]
MKETRINSQGLWIVSCESDSAEQCQQGLLTCIANCSCAASLLPFLNTLSRQQLLFSYAWPEQRARCTTPAMDHTIPDVGSFSYSWPTSKPEPRAAERIGHSDITNFIAADPASASQYSFDFRPSLPQQTEAMADADQVFLNGLLLPLQLTSQQGHEDGDSGHNEPVLMLARSLSLDSSQRMIASAAASRRHRLPWPASQNSSPCNLRGGRAVATVSPAVFRTSKLRLPSFGRCGKQHKWMSFRFLVPLCQKIVRCIWRKAMEKAMDATYRDEYGSAKVKLCDSAIQAKTVPSGLRDAILHCKRSL